MSIVDNMSCEAHFPDDLNGDVLRRMREGGDDLSQPRTVDFFFVFLERAEALAFARLVGDPDKEVSISHYSDRNLWEATVKSCMVPSHQQITALESELTDKANSVGGKADGWGCPRILKG